MSKQPETQEVETTGHSWDGIEEYNNPLPRWWLWTFYGTIVWAILFTIAYPAWPILGDRATPGVLGYSTRADVAADIQSFSDANAPIDAKLVAADLKTVPGSEEMASYAFNGGHALFNTWCAQCHGDGGNGAKGYPNLLDDDWLWGGDIETIATTIRHGIRSEADDDTRDSQMPAFGTDEILTEEEIAQVVQHVRAISGQEHDAELAKAGAVVFEDNCSACHGEDGKGDRDFGAPNLTDAIWLYGGDAATISETVHKSRHGVMPNWSSRLTEAQIRQVAVYVHGLGGGE